MVITESDESFPKNLYLIKGYGPRTVKYFPALRHYKQWYSW